ncbi:hypothetical protein ACP4OV_009989 [Aristida adscensionis]
MELKDLSFRTVFTKSSRILAMFCILKKAPNLEDLHITVVINCTTILVLILHGHGENNEVDMDFLYAQSSVGLFSRLKYFQLSAITGQSIEMEFIEFVLSKAAELEKIEVSVKKDKSKSMEVISSELANYSKASPQAKVIIKETCSIAVLNESSKNLVHHDFLYVEDSDDEETDQGSG